jgi:DNA-binding CsgD family transcriptional regulator
MTDLLLGRDDDLAVLRQARGARAPGVVLVAPPGMGRTSVLAAIVDEWRDRRVDVVLVRATASSRRLRYAALSPVIHDDPDQPPVTGPLSFDMVHDALERRARRGGLVVAIDDAHLVDEASLRVVADLVGVHDAFVVATVDDTFLGLDPLTESSRLMVHTLAPLAPEHIRDLVHERTGERVDADVWWTRSKGNPTALLHLLDDRTHDPGDAIPGGLSGDARRLLALVALAEPFPLAVTADGVVDLASIGVAEDALTDLVGRGIVAVTVDGGRASLRLRHPGQGSRVGRALGAIEARSARRSALASMRRSWTALTPTDQLRVASLAVDAGGELTRDELLDVVVLAPTAGDPALALRLARRGVEQLGRFDDLRRLADVGHEQGAVDDVVTAIDAMAAMATTPREHLAVAIARSQHLLWRCADATAAIDALCDPRASELTELHAIRARMLATVGQPSAAIAEGEPLRLDPDPRVRIQAALAVAHALRRIGRPTRAVAVLDDALANVEAVTDTVLSVSGQVLGVARVLAMVEAGRWTDALAHAARAVSYAERYDETAGRAVALVVQAVAQIESGAPALAIAPLADAVELLTELHQPGGLRWALSARALAHGLMSDAAAARRDLDQLDTIGPHPADLFPSLEPRARAWALVAAADPEGGRASLRAAIERFRGEGALGPAWTCAHDLLSLDQPNDLLEMTPMPDEPLSGLRARHAAAVQHRDVGELEALTDTFEWLGALRWAAECAAARSRAATRAGTREHARRSGERLSQLRARCTGLDIPAVAAGRLLSLSVREREVALLAARGLSSREIADRLGVSARTVDNHLARCFDKLGTRSRAELGTVLNG